MIRRLLDSKERPVAIAAAGALAAFRNDESAVLARLEYLVSNHGDRLSSERVSAVAVLADAGFAFGRRSPLLDLLRADGDPHVRWQARRTVPSR